MGYILHLETATKVCSVAVSNNGELLAIKELEEDGTLTVRTSRFLFKMLLQQPISN